MTEIQFRRIKLGEKKAIPKEDKSI